MIVDDSQNIQQYQIVNVVAASAANNMEQPAADIQNVVIETNGEGAENLMMIPQNAVYDVAQAEEVSDVPAACALVQENRVVWAEIVDCGVEVGAEVVCDEEGDATGKSKKTLLENGLLPANFVRNSL